MTTSPLSPPQNIFQPVTPSSPQLSPPTPYSFSSRTTNVNTTRATRSSEAVLQKSEQELVRENENVLEDVPSPPTLELADDILGNPEKVLENYYMSDRVSDRVFNEKNIEDIQEEYNFDDIKHELDE